MTGLRYLAGYPPHLLEPVRQLIAEGRLAHWVHQRHPDPHAVRTDRALYDYVTALKNRHMKNAGALSRVAYDPALQRVRQALGTHTRVSRVQGPQLKARREIRVASVFREAPADCLRMIVVHELAHLKELDHDKAFYALCTHMAPDYHQLEFDTRLWLTARELGTDAGGLTGPAGPPADGDQTPLRRPVPGR